MVRTAPPTAHGGIDYAFGSWPCVGEVQDTTRPIHWSAIDISGCLIGHYTRSYRGTWQ